MPGLAREIVDEFRAEAKHRRAIEGSGLPRLEAASELVGKAMALLFALGCFGGDGLRSGPRRGLGRGRDRRRHDRVGIAAFLGRSGRTDPHRDGMPKHLIVTADDFGLSPQVNAAVERAHRDGILTAASLMVAAPAAAEAVEIARRTPTLRVGLHLALVEARPALPPSEVPDLVGPDGWFRRDTARFGAELFFSPRMRRQLAREVEAQFAAYAATGLPLDHVDAHQHFHLHPTVASAMIRGRAPPRHARRPHPGRAGGIVRAVEPGSPRALPAVTAPWTRLLGLRMRRAGCAVPDQVFGLSWTGAMTEARVAGLLDRLPDGTTEIYTHPALDGAYPGAAPGYRYRDELDALTSPRVVAAAPAQRRRAVRLRRHRLTSPCPCRGAAPRALYRGRHEPSPEQIHEPRHRLRNPLLRRPADHLQARRRPPPARRCASRCSCRRRPSARPCRPSGSWPASPARRTTSSRRPAPSASRPSSAWR